MVAHARGLSGLEGLSSSRRSGRGPRRRAAPARAWGPTIGSRKGSIARLEQGDFGRRCSRGAVVTAPGAWISSVETDAAAGSWSRTSRSSRARGVVTPAPATSSFPRFAETGRAVKRPRRYDSHGAKRDDQPPGCLSAPQTDVGFFLERRDPPPRSVPAPGPCSSSGGGSPTQGRRPRTFFGWARIPDPDATTAFTGPASRSWGLTASAVPARSPAWPSARSPTRGLLRTSLTSPPPPQIGRMITDAGTGRIEQVVRARRAFPRRPRNLD